MAVSAYVPSPDEQRKRDAIFKVHAEMSDEEKVVLERLQNLLIEAVKNASDGNSRGFGDKAAIELLGKLGLYSAEHRAAWMYGPKKKYQKPQVMREQRLPTPYRR